jgi:hypothetical protein
VADKFFLSPCVSFPIPSATDNETYLQISKVNVREHIVAKLMSKTDMQAAAAPAIISDAAYTSYLETTLVATVGMIRSQEHKWAHCASCFKKGEKTGMRCILCRYNVPHEVQLITDFVGDGLIDVALARSLGSQYMNACCIPVFSVTKSNSDLRFLHAFSMDYSVKYTAKYQGTIDDEKVLKISLDAVARSFRSRRRAEADDPDMDSKRIGEARVRSLLFHSTNFTQVDSTMGFYCLLTKGRHI